MYKHLTILFLAGCIPAPIGKQYIKPHQVEATKLVWNLSYGEADEPPTVYWVEGSQLNCSDHHSWDSDGHCVAGQTHGAYWADVAAWPGMRYGDDPMPSPSSTTTAGSAVAHEFGHIFADRYHLQQFDSQGKHCCIMFEPGGFVDQANAELKERGWTTDE